MKKLLAVLLLAVTLTAAAVDYPIRNPSNECASMYTLNVTVHGDPQIGTHIFCHELCYPQTGTDIDASLAEIHYRQVYRNMFPEAVGVVAGTIKHALEIPEPSPRGWYF
jgi:hypothetical protein